VSNQFSVSLDGKKSLLPAHPNHRVHAYSRHELPQMGSGGLAARAVCLD
jgi:hypothetical protein